MSYDNQLIYPRLAEDGRPRRLYARNGYLLPFPAPDASDELLAAFARAIIDPASAAFAYCQRSDLPDEYFREQQEGCIMYLPVRCGPGYNSGDESAPWSKWPAPKELVEAHMAELRNTKLAEMAKP